MWSFTRGGGGRRRRPFRLRWVLLLVAAAFVWLIAAATEPAASESGMAAAPTAHSPAAGHTRTLARVESSPDAAARFFRKVAAAVRAGVHTGRIELSVTDAEATSALELGARLAEIQQLLSTLSPEELEALDTPEKVRAALDARPAEPPEGLLGRVRYALNPRLRFRDAQVHFRSDGSIVVSGYAHAWSRRVPLHITAVPELEDGRLRMEFRETRLGRLPVPPWVLGGPSNLLASIVGLGQDYARLDALVVADGMLTVSGRVNVPR